MPCASRRRSAGCAVGGSSNAATTTRPSPDRATAAPSSAVYTFAGSRRRLPGVLDDQPADAAAQAGRDLGDDDADHRRRRRQLERRNHAWHGGREAQLAHRLARSSRRSCASARRDVADADSRPRSVPTATGKKARKAPSTATDSHRGHSQPPRCSRPPQLTTSGARAIIGTVCETTRYGISPRRTTPKRAITHRRGRCRRPYRAAKPTSGEAERVPRPGEHDQPDRPVRRAALRRR